MNRKPLLAIALFLCCVSVCSAVDIKLINETTEKVRVKLIANSEKANAHFDIKKQSNRTVKITPPPGSDQVFIAWSGGKLIGHVKVDWKLIEKAEVIEVYVRADQIVTDVKQK